MHLIILMLGIILSSIGLMFIILYTNLFSLGYSFFEFVKFISTRFECLLLFLGIVLILFSMKGMVYNVLFLRSSNKFSRRR
jgi:hypothetical protein